MLSWAVDVALVGISLSMILVLVRLVRGPSTIDRVLALDTMAMNFVAMLVVLSLRFSTDLYLEAVLVLAVLAFVGTTAISKYLMRGRIIE